MPPDDTKPSEQPTAEEIQAQADFDSVKDDEPKPGPAKPEPEPEPPAKSEPPAKPGAAAAPEPKPAPAPKPDYVRITRKDWDDMRAAAAKTASYDQQFSRVFGTVGKLQQTLTALQSGTPRGGKIEIPKDALADMERDFPELAQQIRGALEKTLAGFTGTGPANAEIDPDVLKQHVTKARLDAEVEALSDEHPDWKKIVGHVSIDKGEKPDPNNAFRKWLAGKGADYEKRVSGTLSAAVLSRAIDQFQAETKKPAPTPPNPQRARIADAVRPRGDGGQATGANTAEEQFAAGFGP